jgi:hypothetical protein
MSKLSIAAGLVAVGVLSPFASVLAACPGEPIAASELSGKTVCVAKSLTERYQEYHQAGGALIDYKKGPGHAMDPAKQVGCWRAEGNEVVYSYGAGQEHRYTVYRAAQNGRYCLKRGSEELRPSAVLSGQTRCP